MRHPFLLEILGEPLRDIAWSVVREQPRPVPYLHMMHSGRLYRLLHQILHVLGLHRRVELPGDDIPGVIVG
jgi:hypothetical protein